MGKRARRSKPPKGIPLIFGSPGIRPPVPPRDIPRRQEIIRRQEAQMEEDRRAQNDLLRSKPGRPLPPRVHPGRRGPDQFGPDRPIEGKPKVHPGRRGPDQFGPGRPMPPMGGGAHHMAEMPGNPSWERRNPNWRDDPRWQDKKKEIHRAQNDILIQEEKRGGRGGRDYLIRFLKGGRR